jgi:hypothetical protein
MIELAVVVTARFMITPARGVTKVCTGTRHPPGCPTSSRSTNEANVHRAGSPDRRPRHAPDQPGSRQRRRRHARRLLRRARTPGLWPGPTSSEQKTPVDGSTLHRYAVRARPIPKARRHSVFTFGRGALDGRGLLHRRDHRLLALAEDSTSGAEGPQHAVEPAIEDGLARPSWKDYRTRRSSRVLTPPATTAGKLASWQSSGS